MEKIYPPIHFDCTEKLTNLEDYFNSYAKLCNFLSEDELDLANEELILRKLSHMLVDEKTKLLRKLPDICSIDALSVAEEITPIEVFHYSKFTMKLQRNYGIPEQANELETIKAKMQFSNIVPRKKELDNIVLEVKKSGKYDLTLTDILVFVKLYQPFSATIDKKFTKQGDKLKCSHELVVLASNTLSDLRDKILCASDNGFSLEIDTLKSQPKVNVKEEYPSSLIGINDVLYKDTRHPKAIDYSEVIKHWGIQKKVSDFKVSSMDTVQIKDLHFRLGYPYIYQHRGNCEHILVFTDVRLIKKSDPLCSSNYPYYRNINRYNSEQCNVCHLVTAKWVCCECDRLPHDRTYLCQDCFVSYNYIGSDKIGTFKAYPYYNKSVVM